MFAATHALGKSTVIGRELEPESDLLASVVSVHIKRGVVGAKLQRERGDVPWVEALCVNGCVQVVVRAEHAVDLLAQRCAWASDAGARDVLRDRGRVPLDLIDA